MGVRTIEQHLQDDIVGARANFPFFALAEDLKVADDVAEVARREHRRLLQGKSAVVDHALVFAVDQAHGHAAIGIFAGDDDVARIVGEHLHPVGQSLLVEGSRVSCVEHFHLVPQEQGVEARVVDHSLRSVVHRERPCYRPISWRQYLYIPRIADSEIKVSEVPVGVAGSSLTKCSPLGIRCIPS